MDGRARPDSDLVRSTRKEVDALARERDLAYSKAAHLTIEAYDLNPPRLSGRNCRQGAFQGFPAHWIVVAGDREALTVIDRDDEPHTYPAPGIQDSAALLQTGVLFLYPDAFNRIGHLASIIWHERIHFIQATGGRPAQGLSTEEREIEAYGSMLRNREIFELTEDEVRNIKSQIADYRRKAKAPADRDPFSDRRRLGDLSESAIASHHGERPAVIHGQARAISTRGPAVRGPELLVPASCGDDSGPLAVFAARACSFPSDITEQQLEGIWHCIDKSAAPGDIGQRFGLPHCPKNVFLRLKELKIRGMDIPTVQWLTGYAENISALQPVVQSKSLPQPIADPQSNPVLPPDPEVEKTEPQSPDVPECIRQEGGRCIRWR